MWVQDLEVIFSRLDNLSTSAGFPENAKPFIVMEVWDLGNYLNKCHNFITYVL